VTLACPVAMRKLRAFSETKGAKMRLVFEFLTADAAGEFLEEVVCDFAKREHRVVSCMLDFPETPDLVGMRDLAHQLGGIERS
jgi:hypothetical protein